MTSQTDRIRVIELIQRDESHQRFFFRETSDSSWIPLLKAAGLINSENYRRYYSKGDGRIFSGWYLLVYFENVLKNWETNCKTDPNFEGNVSEILTFIKYFKTLQADEKTWCILLDLIRVIVKLPSKHITVEMLYCIKDWCAVPSLANLASGYICTDIVQELAREKVESGLLEKFDVLLEIILQLKPLHKEEKDQLILSRYEFLLNSYSVNEGLEFIAGLQEQNLFNLFIQKLSSVLRCILCIDVDGAEMSSAVGALSLYLKCTNSDGSIQVEASINDPKTSNIHFQRTFEFGMFCQTAIVTKTFVESTGLKEDDLLEVLRAFRADICGRYCYSPIDEFSRYRYDDALSLISARMLKSLEARACSEVATVRTRLTQLLQLDFFIFYKITLFIISKNSAAFSSIFFDLLSSNKGDLLLEGLYFGYELKLVFNALQSVTKEKMHFLRDKIEGGTLLDFGRDDNIDQQNAWKQERYESLRHLPEFDKLYDEYTKKRGNRQSRLSPAIGRVEFGWEEPKAPLSEERLARMKFSEIALFLESFKPERTFGSPSTEGMGVKLQDFSKKEPTKVLDGLKQHNDIGYYWVSMILRGLSERISESPGEYLNLDSLIDFLINYTSPAGFWAGKYDSEHYDLRFTAGPTVVLSEASRLIDKVVSDGGLPSNEESLESLRKLLISWLSSVEWPPQEICNDPVMHTINCSSGTLLQTYVKTLLSIARKNKAKGTIQNEIFWKEEDRAILDNIFQAGYREVFTVFGMMYRNFLFLDSAWTNNTLSMINDEQAQSYFMSGFFYAGILTNELFETLEDFYRSVWVSGKLTDVTKRGWLCHHASAYVRGLTDPQKHRIFFEILSGAPNEELLEISRFFGNFSFQFAKEKEQGNLGAEYNDIEQRILSFWKGTLAGLVNNQNLEHGNEVTALSIAEELLSLLNYFEVFDSSIEKLVESTIVCGLPPYTSLRSFLKILHYKFNANKEPVARIYGMLMSKGKITPDYPKEEIKDLVSDFCRDETTKEYGLDICRLYTKRGYDFLEDVYTRFSVSVA